jgi:hypothetical protein
VDIFPVQDNIPRQFSQKRNMPAVYHDETRNRQENAQEQDYFAKGYHAVYFSLDIDRHFFQITYAGKLYTLGIQGFPAILALTYYKEPSINKKGARL